MEDFTIQYNGLTIHLPDINSVIETKKNIQKKVLDLRWELKECETELTKLNTFLRLNCKHECVSDHVDLLEGYRECVPIKYCEKCELNFN